VSGARPVRPCPTGSEPDEGRPLTAADHAQAAAEAIRALNHVTLRCGDVAGYAWPADVAAVIGHLCTLAERLPQALEQADRWLTGRLREARVGTDDGTDPDATVQALATALRDARIDLEAVQGGLTDAHTMAAHLTGIEP
jgi:hypothetical protein